MLTIKELSLPEVKLLSPKQFHDDRGSVAETLHERRWADAGISVRFPQENQSISLKKNTVRGLHAQRPPHAQAKLVRVLRGKIMDVAVDARPHSPTYGQHTSAILSEDELVHMLIPAGFLHGFCTLEDHTVVLYKMSDFYAPGQEIGVLWNDPALKIQWPIDPAAAILSDKDKVLPLFYNFPKLEW